MKTILVDAVNSFIVRAGEGFVIFEAMRDLLESYPNRKIILTNANDEQAKTFGLDKMPYDVFSLKHEPEKTEPRYFETLLAHFGLGVGDVVYFEHNKDAVESARRVGITAYHYDPEKKDLAALKAFLDGALE